MGESQKSVGFESYLLSVQSNYDKFQNLGYSECSHSQNL